MLPVPLVLLMNEILNQLTHGMFNSVVDFVLKNKQTKICFSCEKFMGYKKHYHLASCLRKHYQVVISNENLFAFFSNAVTTSVCDYNKFYIFIIKIQNYNLLVMTCFMSQTPLFFNINI